MFVHALESLETRALLSQTVLGEALPPPLPSDNGAVIVDEEPTENDRPEPTVDDDMYEFRPGRDLDTYGDEDEESDGGHAVGLSDGGGEVKPKVRVQDRDGRKPREETIWTNGTLGAEAATFQPEPDSTMAEAVAAAHVAEKPAATIWLGDAKPTALPTIPAAGVTWLNGAEDGDKVTFDFGGEATYRDLML